ncbi:uncharacterized protein J3R85_012206 [Psidium guajava]|nr:uncharacterized protein J3R85_012206 [Psidium guajava]
MEGRSFSSSSNSFRPIEEDGEVYCYCGLPSPRRTSWTQLNPGRRFHGCGRYKEGSKCKYFKWVDQKLSGRATEVILELLEKRHEPPPTFMDEELDDVDSREAEMKAAKSMTNQMKKEVSMLKRQRKQHRALIMFLFCCVAYLMVKCKVCDERKFLSLP